MIQTTDKKTTGKTLTNQTENETSSKVTEVKKLRALNEVSIGSTPRSESSTIDEEFDFYSTDYKQRPVRERRSAEAILRELEEIQASIQSSDGFTPNKEIDI